MQGSFNGLPSSVDTGLGVDIGAGVVKGSVGLGIDVLNTTLWLI